MDYKEAGVDIEAGSEVVRRVRELARGTFTRHVLSDIGSFGGLFDLHGLDCRDPVLVASADGVGTKLKLAFLTGRHDTIGEDLVNHCVNDILVQGARPLFFLDYLATGRLSPDVAASVVSGLARACRDNGCALLGGETAEMPDFYADEEYDLAGFIVGAVDRARIIDGRAVASGDVLIGLPSSGLHTNGYSLARRIVFERLGLTTDTNVPEIGRDLGGALLVPHRTYLPVVEPLLKRDVIKAMAHITGGGITDNLPRVLPQGVSAEVDCGTWEIPALFQWLQAAGDVPDDEMYRTFNMGIGLILVCGEANAASLVAQLRERGEPGAGVIGRVVSGDRIVVYR